MHHTLKVQSLTSLLTRSGTTKEIRLKFTITLTVDVPDETISVFEIDRILFKNMLMTQAEDSINKILSAEQWLANKQFGNVIQCWTKECDE